MLIDAHFHPFDLEKLDPDWKEYYSRKEILGIASCHSYQEFLHAQAITSRALSPEAYDEKELQSPMPRALSPKTHEISFEESNKLPLFISYGIHPQDPRYDDLPIIETLAAERRIDAIGECGFDLFTEEYARTRDIQAHVFMAQVDIAREFDVPLILHLRKSLHELFSRSKELKSMKSLIFHAWPGSPDDAKTLLNRGLNAFFSLGAQALNGRRLSIESIRRIPLDRILVETDAPYQIPRYPNREDQPSIKPVNHYPFCRLQDLYPIYCGLASLRGIDVEYFIQKVEENLSIALKKS